MSTLDQFRIDGRAAVVTGASSGLGVIFAEALADAGARVIVSARRGDRLEDLASRLRDRGVEAVAIPCDVTQEAQVTTLMQAALDCFGSIDILVNNAGANHSLAAEEEAVADFGRMIEVNLMGLYACAHHGGRKMLEAGSGVIINVASILGVVGCGQIPQAGYTAAKGAVVNLTRELAAQWARRGVRVNALAPGWFPTEMTEEMFSDDRGKQWIRRRTPMGRGGEPHEMAGPLLFLASDASSYVTGQVLAVDGGWVAV